MLLCFIFVPYLFIIRFLLNFYPHYFIIKGFSFAKSEPEKQWH